MQMIEMEPKIKNVVVRIPEDLHLPLRRKIAEIDTTFQHVILEGLVDWLHAKDVAAAKRWLARVEKSARNARQLPRELTPESAREKAFVAGLLAFLRDPHRPYRKEIERLLKSMFEFDSKAPHQNMNTRRKNI
jgi:plasmid stabilization system protein ParE